MYVCMETSPPTSKTQRQRRALFGFYGDLKHVCMRVISIFLLLALTLCPHVCATMQHDLQAPDVVGYVKNIKKTENAIHRIAWSLNNFAISLDSSNTVPEEHIIALQQLLNEDSGSNFGTYLQDCTSICKTLTDIINSELSVGKTYKILSYSDFPASMAVLPERLLTLANFLYTQYCTCINNIPMPDELIHPQYPSDDFAKDVPDFALRMQAQVHLASSSLKTILTKIIDINNHDLTDAVRKIYKPMQELSTAVTALYAKLPGGPYSTTKLLDYYSSGLDQTIYNVMEEICSDTSDMAFAIMHGMCEDEFADISSTLALVVENITSASTKICALNSEALEGIAGDKSAQDTVHINNLKVNIDGIIEEVQAISQHITTHKSCAIDETLISHMRRIEASAKDFLQTFCELTHNTEHIDLKPNRKNSFEETPALYQTIADHLNTQKDALSLLIETYYSFQKEDVALAIRALNNSILLLSSSISSQTGSLVNILQSRDTRFCEHVDIKNVLINAFNNIQQVFDQFPVVNLTACCNDYVADFRTIQECCTHLFYNLDALQNDSRVYDWKYHPTWKALMDAVNNFLLAGITEERFVPETDAENCQMFLIKDYLRRLSVAAMAMKNNIETTIKSLDVAIAVPQVFPSTSLQNHGCVSIARVLNEIHAILINIQSLFTHMDQNFIHSDYAADPMLSDALENIITNLPLFTTQLGNNIPKVSALCKECTFAANAYDIYDSIHNTSNAIVASCQDFYLKLETPLCCRRPYETLVDINMQVDSIQAMWWSLGNQETIPCLALNEIDMLTDNIDRTVIVLSGIEEALHNMQTIAKTPPQLSINPCFLYECLFPLHHIQRQTIALQQLTSEVVPLFKIKAIAPKPSQYQTDDFCGNVMSQLTRLSTQIQSIVDGMATFTSHLESRPILRYSESLEDSLRTLYRQSEAITEALRSLQLEIQGLEHNTSKYHCLSHNSLNEIITPAMNLQISLESLQKAICDGCCSYLTEDIYNSDKFINQINQFFEIVKRNHTPNTVLTNMLPYIDDLARELEGLQHNLQEVKNNQESITDQGTSAPHCKIYFLTHNWQQVNYSLQEIVEKLDGCLQSYSNESISEQRITIPSKLGCGELGDHVDFLVIELEGLIENLANLNIRIRESPPFYAHRPEIERVIMNSKTAFETFFTILKFFETSSTGKSLAMHNCKGCNDCNPIESGLTTVMKDSFLEEMNTLANTLSKPGCCVSLADALVLTNNTLLKVQQRIRYVSVNQERIEVTDERYINFLARLDNLQVSLTNLQKPLTAFANFKLANLGTGLYPKQLNTDYINAINMELADFDEELNSVLEIFCDIPDGAILIKDKGLDINRDISGCEQMALVLRTMKETMCELVSDMNNFIGVIQQLETRHYRPQIIHQLEGVYTGLKDLVFNMNSLADNFTQKPICPYCEEKNFRQSIKDSLDTFRLNMSSVITSFGEDQDYALIGTLRRYCCSESNVLLRNMARECEHIHYSIQQMINNPHIGEHTFDGALTYVLNPVREAFNSFENALIDYGAAVTHSVIVRVENSLEQSPLPPEEIGHSSPEICEVAAHIGDLAPVAESVSHLKDTILYLTTYTQTENNLPLIISTPQKPHVRDDTMDSITRINKAFQNILFALTELGRMMQADLSYAAHSGLIDFLNWLKNEPVEECLQLLRASDLCPYCSLNFNFSFPHLREKIENIIEALQHPSCCAVLNIAIQEINQSSEDIILMADAFLNIPSLALQHNPDLMREIVETMQMLSQCSGTFSTQLRSIPRNTPCILRELSDSFATLQGFTKQLYKTMSSLLEKFANMSWTNNTSRGMLTDCGDTGLDVFCTALQKMALVSQYVGQVLQKKQSINYTPELIQDIHNIVQSLRSIAPNLGTVATQFAACIECYACREKSISYATYFKNMSASAENLYAYMSHIEKYVRDKCCSSLFEALSQFIYQIQRINACLTPLLASHVFRAWMYQIGTPCPILDYLNITGFKNIKETILSVFDTLQAASSKSCPSYHCTQHIQELTANFTTIANLFESQYITYVSLSVPLPQEIIFNDFSCSGDMINKLIRSLQDLSALTQYFHRLQSENSNDSSSLPITTSLIKASENMHMLEDLLKTQTSIGKAQSLGCPQCTGTFALLRSLRELCKTIAQQLNPIKQDTKECCRSFSLVTAQCERQVRYLIQQMQYFLNEEEKYMLCQREMPLNEDNLYLQHSDSILSITYEPLENVLANFQSMNQALQNESPSGIDYCFAPICNPLIRNIYQNLRLWNKLLHKNLSDTYATYAVVEPDVLMPITSGCAERLPLVKSIVGEFNTILAQLQRFSNLFLYADVHCAAPSIHQKIEKTGQILCDILTNINQWSENNRLVTKYEMGPNGELEERRVCHFCPRCTESIEIQTALKQASKKEMIEQIFENLQQANYPQAQIRVQKVTKMHQEICRITRYIHILTNTPQLSCLFMQPAKDNGWQVIVDDVAGFIPLFTNLPTLSASFETNPKAYITLFEELCDRLENIADDFADLLTCGNIAFDAFHNKDNSFIVRNDSQTITEASQDLIVQCQLLSSAWNILCYALEHCLPPAHREHITNAMDVLYEYLKTIYRNFPLTDLLGVFEQNPSVPAILHSEAKNIMECMTHRTGMLLQALSTYDCCDQYARRIASILHNIAQGDQILHTALCLQSEKFGLILADIESFFRDISAPLQNIWSTLNTTFAQFDSKSRCHSQVICEPLKIIDAYVSRLIQNWAKYTGTKWNACVDWDELSKNSSNDCKFLPSLYHNMAEKTRSFFSVLFTLTKKSAECSPSTLRLHTLRETVQETAKLLNAVITISETSAYEKNILCRSCETHMLLHSLSAIHTSTEGYAHNLLTLLNDPWLQQTSLSEATNVDLCYLLFKNAPGQEEGQSSIDTEVTKLTERMDEVLSTVQEVESRFSRYLPPCYRTGDSQLSL